VTLSVQSAIAGAYLLVRLQQANLANALLAQTNQADHLQIAIKVLPGDIFPQPAPRRCFASTRRAPAYCR